MSLDVCLLEPAGEVYSANITHNLTKMAAAAGIYRHLWRPEDLGAQRAGDLVHGLEQGLLMLKSGREHFLQYNAPNLWGTYDDFVPWVENYLNACKAHPAAAVRVYR